MVIETLLTYRSITSYNLWEPMLLGARSNIISGNCHLFYFLLFLQRKHCKIYVMQFLYPRCFPSAFVTATAAPCHACFLPPNGQSQSLTCRATSTFIRIVLVCYWADNGRCAFRHGGIGWMWSMLVCYRADEWRGGRSSDDLSDWLRPPSAAPVQPPASFASQINYFAYYNVRVK